MTIYEKLFFDFHLAFYHYFMDHEFQLIWAGGIVIE